MGNAFFIQFTHCTSIRKLKTSFGKVALSEDFVMEGCPLEEIDFSDEVRVPILLPPMRGVDIPKKTVIG